MSLPRVQVVYLLIRVVQVRVGPIVGKHAALLSNPESVVRLHLVVLCKHISLQSLGVASAADVFLGLYQVLELGLIRLC